MSPSPNPSSRRRQGFSLRLSPEARKLAADQARREGISLNQFIGLAVAEKIGRAEQDALQHPAPTVAKPRISTR